MAEPISIQQLKDASEDAITLADFIYKPANVMIPRRLAADINSLQYYLDYMSSYAQHSYETYDEMVANAVNLPNGVSIFVTNDLDTTKNGIYTYNGTSFVKGEYQPENAAKDFVEAKLGGLQVFDGKVRAQDVSTADGSTQDVKNIEFRNELDAIPFEGGVLADNYISSKLPDFGAVVRNQGDINKEKRRTPRDFGALGGVNDDTEAVIDCINTGYFLIDENFTVRPFTISGKELDGEFTRNGKLNITESAGQDSITFFECSGVISGLNAHENYSSGSWATVVFSRCEDMTINKPQIQDGKVIGLCVQNCTNTHVYNGKGNAALSQSWYLISCIESTMNFCRIKNEGSGFYIIGKGYKSSTNNRSEIDEQLSLGMAMNYCYADVASLGFDINGAVGAELFKCVGNQNFKDTAAAVFQVKQSTNLPSETKRLTQKNKVTQCVAIKCSRGFATQNGEDVVFKDNYILGSKGNGIIINDTPRVTIDGLYCYDLFQQNAVISEDVSIVTTSSTSSVCHVRNVQLVQRTLPEDAAKVILFNIGGSSSSLSGFTLDASGAVIANPTKLKALCRNTGLHFTYGEGIKPLVASMYENIILDETSSAIYPRTFTRTYDFNKDAAGTTYFNIPERGLAVGNVRVFTRGSTAGVKLAVGTSTSVAGLYSLKEPAAGMTVTPPVSGFVAENIPLGTRLELTSAVVGTAIVQVRGIDLY